MPHRHHRHNDHGTDVDDEFGPLTLVDAESGMLAHADPHSVAEGVESWDDDELSPEEAALHIERVEFDD
jgi:hypothetical protein